MQLIEGDIRWKLEVKGINEIKIYMVLSLTWTTNRINENGRKKLRE